ncbi:hypothetical protein CVT26_015469 [Gymnopilus dilepis]|uniref:Uncharacterized protein n=1 Tax=Gymnopilus dilepis TaxID=231916 RepID=A0A409WHT6_9AGAR|nr:hypothetical protein CVT26_015469 [Gymnopilus dilepis]
MGRNQASSENGFSSDASPGLRRYTPSTERDQTPFTSTSEGDIQEVKPVFIHRGETRKVRRQFSATPQPEMETRLRRTIKATPGGHDLARSSERRRAQRERTHKPAKATDRKQLHGESERAMSTGTEGSRIPLHSDAQSSRQTLLESPPFNPRPSYNHGWIPQPFAIPQHNLGPAGGGPQNRRSANLTTGDHRPPSIRDDIPHHNSPDPDSMIMLGPPFEEVVRHNQRRTVESTHNVERGNISKSRSSSTTPLFRQRSSRYDLSPTQADALVQGLTDLDVLVERISESTGLRSREILQELQERDGLESDLSKIYMALFLSRTSTESDRPPKENRGGSDDPRLCPNTIQAAYEAFQRDTPHHTLFLKRWWHVHETLLTHRRTHSRQEDFDCHTAALRKLVDQASMTSGFETIFWTVGNDIRRDQSLFQTYSSALVTDFFHGRLCISNSDVESHLKAHVYDQVSRKNLSKNLHIRGGPSLNPVPEDNRDSSRASGPKIVLDSDQINVQPSVDDLDIASQQESPVLDAPAPPKPSVIQEGEEELDNVKWIHHPPASDKPAITNKKNSVAKQRVNRLRQGFHNLTKDCNIPQLQTSTVLLAKMPEILSRNGWVMDNWPEDVDFPCDLKTGKGLAGLSVEDQERLLESLNDPSFPLKVVKKSTKAIPATDPSIFGAPPAPDSQHVRGRRRFLDAERTWDRNGHPRLNHQKAEELTVVPKHVASGDVSGGPGERNIGIKRPAEIEEQQVGKKSRKGRENTAALNITDGTDLPSGHDRNNTDLTRSRAAPGRKDGATPAYPSSGDDRPAFQAFSSNTLTDHTSDPGESDADRHSGRDDEPRTYSRNGNGPFAESGVHGWYSMHQAGQHPQHWAQQVMPFQFSNNQGPHYGPGIQPALQYIPQNAQGPSVVPGNSLAPFPPFRIPGRYGHPPRAHANDSK